MSTGLPNPFLTSTNPCWCESGQPIKDCCGPRTVGRTHRQPDFDYQLLIYIAQVPQRAADLNTQLACPIPDGQTYAHFLMSVIKGI